MLAALGAWWVSVSWKGWAAGAGTQIIEQILVTSGLPAEEQAEVMTEVDRIADAFESGELTLEESGQLIQDLAKSPVISLILVSVVEQSYLNNSGLDEEQRAAGSVAIQRFSRGVADGSIDASAIDEMMQHVADRDADGKWQLRSRDQVSDDDLRALILVAKTKADEAGIAEQVESIDPSDEIKKIVDQALGGP